MVKLKTETDTDETTEAYLVGIAIAVGIVAIVVVYQGWAFCTLFNWLICPDLHEITLARSIGVCALFNVIHVKASEPKCGTNFKWSSALLSPILLVGIGWIAKQFMV